MPDSVVERGSYLDDPVVLDVQFQVAPHPAVRADGRGHRLRRFVPGAISPHVVLTGGHQRPGRAHADAIPAVHAGGAGQGHVVFGRYPGVEAAARDGDGEGVLRVLAAGLHALVAQDAARVVAHVRVVV